MLNNVHAVFYHNSHRIIHYSRWFGYSVLLLVKAKILKSFKDYEVDPGENKKSHQNNARWTHDRAERIANKVSMIKNMLYLSVYMYVCMCAYVCMSEWYPGYDRSMITIYNQNNDYK